MWRNVLNSGFAAICVTVVILVSSNGQQSTSVQSKPTVASANRKDSVEKTLSDLTEQIKDLKERVQILETEQAKLRTQPQAEALPVDLTELSRFDCEADFNRAHAMALAQGTRGSTLEGAAAMNCTQRLAKVTEKVMRNLEHR
jgi:hypothetical protein